MTQPSVLAVVSLFPAPSQTFILRKLTGLQKAGHPVTVAATRFTDGASEYQMGQLLLAPWQHPLASLDKVGRAGWMAVARGLADSLRSDSSPLDLRQRVSEAPLAVAEADIVHFEFSGLAISYRGVFDRLRPARLVLSCRGAAEQITPLVNPTRAAALLDVFNSVDLIHCVSQDMANTVESLGAPPDRILVNRPAVPVSDFAPLAAERAERADHGDPLRVLSIGRLHWKKGLDDGLRAVAQVAQRGIPVSYRVAGEGPEREKLTYLADQLGIAPSVELLGVRTQLEVRDLLGWADVLLLPSLSEGISNAALEAMAAGLPVVSTTCGGMDEVITTDVDGFLVDIADIDAMADRLAAIATDTTLGQVGVTVAARAVADFDQSRQIKLFSDAYNALVSS